MSADMHEPSTPPEEKEDSEKLLPCPFCGCEEIVGCSDDGEHWEMCTHCGIEGPVTTRYSGDEDGDCIRWNTRSRRPSAAIPVEAIKYAIGVLGPMHYGELERIERLRRTGSPGAAKEAERRLVPLTSHISALRALITSAPGAAHEPN